MCKDMISGIAVYLLQLQEFIATLSDCSDYVRNCSELNSTVGNLGRGVEQFNEVDLMSVMCCRDR